MIKKFIDEFKAFAVRGNVVDLAVGVVIGAAFGKIVTSLVENIITPLIGAVSGGGDFAHLKLSFVSEVTGKTVDLPYGKFFQSIIDFLIVSFAIFMAIKLMNTFMAKQEATQEQAPAAPVEPSPEVKLLSEIRDLLKK